MRRLGGVVGVSSVVACWGALFFGAAGAQAAWTAPVEISAAGTFTSGPQLAVGGAGDVTAAWVDGFSTGAIKSAFLPASGTWGAPQTPITTTSCKEPSLAANSAGAAVVVAECGATKFRAAYRATNGNWGSMIEVPESEAGNHPHAAIDDAGNAIVVWEGEDKTARSSYRAVGTGTWGTAQLVSPAGNEATEPQVAMNPTGLAVAIWRYKTSTLGVFKIETKSRLPGSASTWGGLRLLSDPTGNSAEPQIVINAGGRSAVWIEKAFAEERWVLESAWGDGCNECGWGEDAAAHQVGDLSSTVSQPQVAIDGDGKAVSVWRSEEVPNLTGLSSVKSATTAFINGPWSEQVMLSTEPLHVFSSAPLVAADTAGEGTAAWIAKDEKLYAAQRPPGGAFVAAVPVAAEADEFTNIALKMDAGGDSFLLWGNQFGEGRTSFALHDGTPPALSSIVVPVSGDTAHPATMSAAGKDVWSSPTIVHWDFGDGSTGTGDSVSHTYSSAGTKTVTVTAVDAAGNTSAAQTRQIAVSKGAGGSREPVSLTVSVPKQPWSAIAKAKAVKLLCTLDVTGECKAKATLTGSVAERLGLVKRAKATQIGQGTVKITAGNHATELKVKLSARARKAIAKATDNVPVKLTVTGSATGRQSATQTKKLKIKRP